MTTLLAAWLQPSSWSRTARFLRPRIARGSWILTTSYCSYDLVLQEIDDRVETGADVRQDHHKDVSSSIQSTWFQILLLATHKPRQFLHIIILHLWNLTRQPTGMADGPGVDDLQRRYTCNNNICIWLYCICHGSLHTVPTIKHARIKPWFHVKIKLF